MERPPDLIRVNAGREMEPNPQRGRRRLHDRKTARMRILTNVLAAAVALVVFSLGWRWLSRRVQRPAPTWLAWSLKNPFMTWILGARSTSYRLELQSEPDPRRRTRFAAGSLDSWTIVDVAKPAHGARRGELIEVPLEGHRSRARDRSDRARAGLRPGGVVERLARTRLGREGMAAPGLVFRPRNHAIQERNLARARDRLGAPAEPRPSRVGLRGPSQASPENRTVRRNCVDLLERETGVEPATLSLGS